MSVKWTPSQANAIDSYGGKLVVSAGAGSGKTAVLVERAIKLMTDRKLPADRLLIITFTNAAAEELRERLYSAVDRLCRDNASDTELKRQSVLVRRAHIGTFDSYCKKLCFEHFSELAIPPDFTLATGAFRDTLRDQAIEKTLEVMYSDSDFCAFSDMFGKARSDSSVEKQILEFNGFLEKLYDPEAYKRACIDRLENAGFLSDSLFGKFLLSRARRSAEYLLDLCQKGCAVTSLDEALQKNYRPTFVALQSDAEQLLSMFDDGYDSVAAFASSIEIVSMKQVRGDDFPEKTSAKQIRAAAASQLKKIKEKYLFSSEAAYADECATMLPAVRALFRAEQLFEQNLNELKSRRRAYEFADIDRLALSLLISNGRPTPLAGELSQFYSAVMVDEYQDTDEIQSAVYGAISDAGRKLFIVGDAKQSIYRFRRAEPRIMLRERAQASPAESGLFPRHIKLLENFRSESYVIDAVNSVFDVIMTPRTGDIDYLSERLVAGRPESDGIGLRLVISTAAEPESDFQPRYAALKIKQLMADDSSLRFSDFAIIASSIKGYKDDYERVFKDEGVPIFCDVSGTVYSTDEGALLLSVLSAIDNPLRDIDLSALLTTPAIGFGATELFALRQQQRHGSLYPLLLSDNSDASKKAAEIISQLTFLKNRLPIDDLAAACVNILRLDDWALSRPGGEYRLGNIYSFIDAAREAKSAADISLERFIALAERARESDSSDRRSPPPNTVVLKTIHTSKGLEWKYVFLAGTEKGFRHDTDSLIYDSELGVGAHINIRTDGSVTRTKTAAFGALSVQNAEKGLSERIRLLYVALTRAKTQTIALAETDSAAKITQSLYNISSGLFSIEELVSDCGSFFEWIMLSIIKNNRAAMQSFSLSAGTTIMGASAIEVIESLEKSSLASDDSGEALTAEQYLELKSRLSFSAPEAELSSLPVKRSVTSLSKGEEQINIPRPSFAMARGLTSAERGTAMHMFMQYSDYALAAADPEAELLRLVDNSYISEAYAESIDTERLFRLLQSDFFKNLLKSDRLLREYEFFLPVKASELAGRPLSPDGEVIIQGIADCVAIKGDSAIIVDYKSDRVDSESVLADRYRPQLMWYKRAVEAALGLRVGGCYVYSFALNSAVRVL